MCARRPTPPLRVPHPCVLVRKKVLPAIANNGIPTYITGSHYMYLQWTRIDVGYPDFREANRIFYIFLEACKADHRSFGPASPVRMIFISFDIDLP